MTDVAAFRIDREQLEASGRVVRGAWTEGWLDQVEGALDQLARATGHVPVQRGRVVAVRRTDVEGLYSALKTSLYHSRYDSMLDTTCFFRFLQPAHNSYEPFRGETILFLFLYVGKNVYDGLSMFTYGRPTRIIGGSRHSVPWGVEAAPTLAGRDAFVERHMQTMARVAELDALGKGRTAEQSAELESLRCELPVCYCMAPFLLEFSEEALVTKVFKQRLWERGVASRDTGIVAADMWECCKALDPKAFEAFYDYNGPHVTFWEDSMRRLRESDVSVHDLMTALGDCAQECGSQRAYDALMAYFEGTAR